MTVANFHACLWDHVMLLPTLPLFLECEHYITNLHFLKTWKDVYTYTVAWVRCGFMVCQSYLFVDTSLTMLNLLWTNLHVNVQQDCSCPILIWLKELMDYNWKTSYKLSITLMLINGMLACSSAHPFANSWTHLCPYWFSSSQVCAYNVMHSGASPLHIQKSW